MIKDENLRNRLLKSFPKISDEELESISKEHMPQYVVYKQFKPGKYECYCTRCGKSYINDTVSGRNYVPVVGHKKKGVCLMCGNEVTFLAKGRGRKSVWDKANFAIYKLKGGNVYVQIYQICAEFTEAGKADFDFQAAEKLYEIKPYRYHRYVFTPDGAQKWEHWYHYDYKDKKYNEVWECKKTEGNPCFQSSAFYSETGYKSIGEECIKQSFLRFVYDAALHSMSRQVIQQYDIKFFCEYCKHPNIEYLLKTGFGDIIEDKLIYNTMSGIKINWKQNDVKKMLKLNKAEIEALADVDCNTLNHYYRLRKLDPAMPVDDLRLYAKRICDVDNVEWLVKHTELSLVKILNYRDKQKIGFNDWRDYIRQCIKLQYDITDNSISRPKDFFSAHERLTKILEAMANQEKQRLFEANNRLREEMQYVDEELGLMIVLPKSIDDIVREGKIQNHCVGGYADRHAEGKLHILFLRKISEPEKPYYTMEVNLKGDIVQCRGYANNWTQRGGKPKTDDVIEFEKRYKEYLKKVFKHTKSKAA